MSRSGPRSGRASAPSCTTLFRAGAFAGTTPRDAYFVRCDSGTMSQNDIDNGTLNVLIGIAAVKPAEFVLLRIQQMARRP